MGLRWLILLFVVSGLAGLVRVSPGIGMLTLITVSVLPEFFLVRKPRADFTGRFHISRTQSASDDGFLDLLEAFRRDTHV